MGRAGIEPATLGLKVDASSSRGLAAAVRTACLSQIHLACVRVLWECLVDPLLTPCLVLLGNRPRACAGLTQGGFAPRAPTWSGRRAKAVVATAKADSNRRPWMRSLTEWGREGQRSANRGTRSYGSRRGHLGSRLQACRRSVLVVRSETRSRTRRSCLRSPLGWPGGRRPRRRRPSLRLLR
jgi:hypothetical protein